jgi:hypothetical protein
MVGQKAADRPFEARKPMSRGALFLIILGLLLVGGLYFLSSHARPVPVTNIEADVSRDPAAK